MTVFSYRDLCDAPDDAQHAISNVHTPRSAFFGASYKTVPYLSSTQHARSFDTFTFMNPNNNNCILS
eukprot:scaffold107708_cov20-Tisochrysis_lutea.AAC.1